MSGWEYIEEGKVKIIHHSTASVVQILITDREEYQPGHFRDETNEIWIDYYQLQDLKTALNKIVK